MHPKPKIPPPYSPSYPIKPVPTRQGPHSLPNQDPTPPPLPPLFSHLQKSTQIKAAALYQKAIVSKICSRSSLRLCGLPTLRVIRSDNELSLLIECIALNQRSYLWYSRLADTSCHPERQQAVTPHRASLNRTSNKFSLLCERGSIF